MTEAVILSEDEVFAAMLVRLCGRAGVSAVVCREASATGQPVCVADLDSARCDIPEGAITLSFSRECTLRRPFSIDAFTALVAEACCPDGAARLERASRTVSLGARGVRLTKREFELAELLSSRGGETVSRAELLEAVWRGTEAGAGVVDVYVCYLRRKLESAFGRRCVGTVRGGDPSGGYRWLLGRSI